MASVKACLSATRLAVSVLGRVQLSLEGLWKSLNCVLKSHWFSQDNVYKISLDCSLDFPPNYNTQKPLMNTVCMLCVLIVLFTDGTAFLVTLVFQGLSPT